MGRTFAIGDIHGCARALKALIDHIGPTEDDALIPLGDYVDRGPESKAVIEQLIELQTRCQLTPLMGNHEIMMLAALESVESLSFWLQCGGKATVESYGGDLTAIPNAHLEFLRSCLNYFETSSHIFLHANYDPELPLDEQPEKLLFWEHLAFYDNGVHTIPGRHFSNKIAIVGHTPQESGEILDLGDIICIDTFCVGSGRLTALEVNSGQVCQANKEGQIITAL